ncbi:LOW QUALITY PROTEIN: hypothetical protein NC653_005956 [Populus alba x Populus x berolinensis]|uniref:Uncharacterized protein n=1 Tax=Populus alba x Populus x berolinensis TaxID=444605 RepID=A0AAD6RDI6_9ROSI|nr:LOW QUALITY PROTEIN: hypothetical protein NC653_005956 [Populus alba x Populus x berolinensis]
MSSSSSSLRTTCRPHTVLTSFMCSSGSRHQPRSRIRVSFRTPPDGNKSPPSFFSPWLIHTNNNDPWFRVNHKRTIVRAWTEPKSPYETLELERDAEEEDIKFMTEEALLRMEKQLKLDSSRFKLAYVVANGMNEKAKVNKSDMDNRVNPMKGLLYSVYSSANVGQAYTLNECQFLFFQAFRSMDGVAYEKKKSFLING